MSWNKTETKKLIELWECHECLWNHRSKDYQKKNLRINALAEIGSACDKTSDDVKKKLHNLRSQMSGKYIFIYVFLIRLIY